MTARAWITCGILAIFLAGPVLQLQCEIACAGDDGASTCPTACPMSSVASVASPDTCPGAADLGPMLPATSQARRQIGVAAKAIVFDTVAETTRLATLPSLSPSRDPSSGDPPQGRRLPLRI